MSTMVASKQLKRRRKWEARTPLEGSIIGFKYKGYTSSLHVMECYLSIQVTYPMVIPNIHNNGWSQRSGRIHTGTCILQLKITLIKYILQKVIFRLILVKKLGFHISTLRLPPGVNSSKKTVQSTVYHHVSECQCLSAKTGQILKLNFLTDPMTLLCLQWSQLIASGITGPLKEDHLGSISLVTLHCHEAVCNQHLY